MQQISARKATRKINWPGFSMHWKKKKIKQVNVHVMDMAYGITYVAVWALYDATIL